MFLSTENPPHDPLSSSPSPSSFLHLTTSSDVLGQTHLQNFSIRDYAYSNRKNNIKNNWPFSPKSLQLCSTRGVTDPLPPFHKVSNVSNQFKTTASSSSGKQIVSHVHRGSGFAKLGVKGGCSQSRIIKNGFGTSTSVEIVVAGTSNNNKNNKKSGRGGMVKSKEDTCGGTGLVVTTTCPICKTFSSASNTTLNAHIDQCLSVDSELPPVITTKPNKPRVDQCLSVDSDTTPVSSTKPNKPRAKALMKVKTMVDIYATAKRCTLEDLDQRNGTKWASVFSHTKNQVVADKSEVSKKRKVSPVGVGPVYIDDKGQKLRILTEFSEKQHEGSISEKKSVSQGSKESNESSRKRRGGKKQYKYLKLTNLKANNTSEIHECKRGFSGEGSSSKGHHRRIYNQRMLSKRGLVSKKLNEKGGKSYALRDQPSEDDDDNDDSWSRGDPDSSPLNKQKLRREVSSGRNKTMFGSKGVQSRSSRVQMSEKEEKSLARTHVDTLQFKKRLPSIQEDKYPLGKNAREVADASPRATSMRKSSPPFVANGWRRLSLPVELKKAPLDLSEEEDGKWESEMTQERELSSDDDYVSGDDSPSFSRYDDSDDDDEESSDEEEEDYDDDNNNNNKRANVLDQSNDETIPSSERAMYYYYSEQVEEMYEQEDVRFDSEVRREKGSLFVEVDTIPIPGPPGSFLPSPRDMCYDENLGNSSVVTSQIQSFDRNSSESPVSAVSNFASGRSSFCVPSHQETRSTIDKTEPPSRLGSNDIHESCSCCCQRKERLSEGIALNHHQTSHLLQRRAAAAYSSTAMNLTKSPPIGLETNHPFEQSPYMIKQDLDLQSKFSNRTVVVPPSPSPVLRLMGKDLMVMNQVEADNNEGASQTRVKPTTTEFLDSLPCAGTGLCFNAGLYLRNSFESTYQPPQTQQASPFRNSFDHVKYLSPS